MYKEQLEAHSGGMLGHFGLGSISIPSFDDCWVDRDTSFSLSHYFLIYFFIFMLTLDIFVKMANGLFICTVLLIIYAYIKY